ncbi:MAG: hypothetical protein R2750_05085 [Bacteroidales bacterium]
MSYQRITPPKNIDDEIEKYIRKKKEENSALKKLLVALEDAKRNNGKSTKFN